MPCGVSVVRADVVGALDKLACLPVIRRLRIAALAELSRQTRMPGPGSPGSWWKTPVYG